MPVDQYRDRAADDEAFLGRGGGLAYLHGAVDGSAQRIGQASPGGHIKYQHGLLDLAFHKDARNFDCPRLVDERYRLLTGGPAQGAGAGHAGRGPAAPAPVLDGRARPGPGARAHPRHSWWTFGDPLYRVPQPHRHRPGGQGAGGPVQRARPARGRLRPVNRRRQGRKDLTGSGPTTAAVNRTRPTQEQEDLDLRSAPDSKPVPATWSPPVPAGLPATG
jgi:hypothetical protein